MDFRIFGFLDYRSRCLITVMDKWAKCESLRVVGGGEFIFIFILIFRFIFTYVYVYIYISLGFKAFLDTKLTPVAHGQNRQQRIAGRGASNCEAPARKFTSSPFYDPVIFGSCSELGPNCGETGETSETSSSATAGAVALAVLVTLLS